MPGTVEIDGKSFTYDEARRAGYVPERTDMWTDKWVRADAFIVRGVFSPGDGAMFSTDKLAAAVRHFLAAYGVDAEVEAFLKNAHPNHPEPELVP